MITHINESSGIDVSAVILGVLLYCDGNRRDLIAHCMCLLNVHDY